MKIENMIKCCKNLTPTESQLAKYIISNKEELEKLTIQDLSNITYISRSGIHRFCKKIGLDGFKELKVTLAKDVANSIIEKTSVDVNFPFDETDSFYSISNKLQLLYKMSIIDTFNYIDLKQLKAVAELLRDSEVIDIYTASHNLYTAYNFQDKMLSIGKKVNCPDTSYKKKLVALSSCKGSVAIIISYSGRATFIKDVLKVIKEKNIPVIMICKEGTEKKYEGIDNFIYLSDRENLRYRISQFSSHISVQYVMDILFSCMFKLNYQEYMNHIRNNIELLDDRPL